MTVLAGTTKPLSGREVGRLANATPNTTSLALRRLSEHGIVTVEEAGRGAVLLYTLNRHHLAVDAVLALTSLRPRFLSVLKDALAAWPIQPTHASLFGSTARGDGDTTSDVDIFVARPQGVREDDEEWRAQIDGLARSVREWTGNHAGISEVSDADVKRLRRERPPIVAELKNDAIVLAGKSVEDLLGRRM